MSLKDIINADLQVIEKDLGNQYITWQGESYLCIPTSNTSDSILNGGGFSVTNDKTFFVRKELFTDGQPAKNDIISFDGTDYRINTIVDDTTKAFLKFSCTDTNRGL